MKKTKHFISAGVFAFFFFLAFGSMDDKKDKTSSIENLNNSNVHPQEIVVETDSKKEAVTIKLKEKARQDWPNDYTTQEFWLKEQLEAYDFMLTIDDNPTKSKAQKDWPLDFVTQKYWYEEQIEAKKRIE